MSALLIYRIFLRPRVWEKYPAVFGRRKEPGTDHSGKEEAGGGGGEGRTGSVTLREEDEKCGIVLSFRKKVHSSSNLSKETF